LLVAERQGFEPWNTREDVTGIPVQRLRPLGHLSVNQTLRSGLRRRTHVQRVTTCVHALRPCRVDAEILVVDQICSRRFVDRSAMVFRNPGREGYTAALGSGKRDSGGLQGVQNLTVVGLGKSRQGKPDALTDQPHAGQCPFGRDGVGLEEQCLVEWDESFIDPA
jgi:hypothetical protein